MLLGFSNQITDFFIALPQNSDEILSKLINQPYCKIDCENSLPKGFGR
jgi:hypothetical protein